MFSFIQLGQTGIPLGFSGTTGINGNINKNG